MKILLADDHGLFVEGLQNLLVAGGYDVVGTAHDGMEALQQARALQPDLILMDIRMPNLDGLAATRLIKAELPDIMVVILTTSADDVDLFESLKSGASGYLLKNLQPDELFQSLHGLERGEAPLSRELSARLLREFNRQAVELDRYTAAASPSVHLTARQLEILELAAQGKAYKEIASLLDVSEHTVKYHMGEILQRLELKNREQAIAYALQTGLVRGKPRQSQA